MFNGARDIVVSNAQAHVRMNEYVAARPFTYATLRCCAFDQLLRAGSIKSAEANALDMSLLVDLFTWQLANTGSNSLLGTVLGHKIQIS